MGKLGYCVPCGEERNPVDATEVVDGDPMCQAHSGAPARREQRETEGAQARGVTPQEDAPVAEETGQPAVKATIAGRERDGRVREARGPHGKGRISDEIKAKVKAEFGSMSNEKLGLKYGISGVTVGTICKGLSKRPPLAADLAAEKKALAKKLEGSTRVAKLTGTERTAAHPVVMAAMQLGAGPAVTQAVGFEMVSLHVTEAALDRLLLAVSLANKQRAVQFLINEGAV